MNSSDKNRAIDKNKALERIFVYQAVEYGYLTEEQLIECIAEHEQREIPVPLLTICKQKNYLTPSQVNHLMSKRMDASVARVLLEGLGGREPKKVYKAPMLEEDSESARIVTSAIPKISREDKSYYDKTIVDLNKTLEREQKQRDFLKRRIEELEKSVKKAELEKQEIQVKKQKEIATLESELICYKGLKEQIEKKLKEVQENLEYSETLLTREKDKAKGLYKLLEQSGKEQIQCEEERLKAEADLEKEKKELKYLQNKYEKQSKEKSQLKDDYENAEELISNLSKEVEKLESENKELSKEVKTLKESKEVVKEVETKRRELEEKTEKQAELEEKLNEQKELENTLKAEQNKLEKAIEDLKKENQEIHDKIKEQKEKLEEKDSNIYDMEEKFHKERINLESELKKYQQKSENLEIKLKQYQDSLKQWDEMQKEQKALQERLKEEEEKVEIVTVEKEEVNTKLKELEERLERFKQVYVDGELEDGTILPGSNGESYEIQKILGRGGMGIAYSALRHSDENIVVVKTLLPEGMSDMKVVMRFVQEARTILTFNHENLVKAYDFYQGKDLSFFVMEFLDGESVEDTLDEQAFIDPIEATKIILGIAKALQYLEDHHLVHRDLKPANIVVNRDGCAKLVDFGIVKMTDRTCSLTTQDIILGTPYYLSPEQIYQTNVDIRSDIYSLGATYYHMVVGEVPFPGDNPLDVIQQRLKVSPRPGKKKPDLPKPVVKIIERMMHRSVQKRHSTASELVTDMENVLKNIKK